MLLLLPKQAGEIPWGWRLYPRILTGGKEIYTGSCDTGTSHTCQLNRTTPSINSIVY